MATDLQRYVSNGKITKLKHFLDQGTCNVNDRLPNGWTALHRATEENKVKMMKVLMDYGANIDAKNDSGFTPLMIAVQSGNLEAIKLLISHKADVNAQNGYAATPLMLASADGRLAIIEYLLKNGADLEITDYRKQNAADWAEERGNNEVISYLTKYAQDQQGNLTKVDIEKVMKEHESSSIRKRGSSLSPAADRLNADSGMQNRPSTVSITSEYGESAYLSMHSTMVNLQDRMAELELRVKKGTDMQHRLERVESRLGINEMLNLIDRNRVLEERIRVLETEKSKEKTVKSK